MDPAIWVSRADLVFLWVTSVSIGIREMVVIEQLCAMGMWKSVSFSFPRIWAL